MMDHRIKKVYIPGKGYGCIAINDIPINTIVLKEKPLYHLEKINFSDMIEILYSIFRSPKEKIDQLDALYPRSLDEASSSLHNLMDDIRNEFERIESLAVKNKKAKVIYDYLSTIDKNKIMLYCLKYSCNAFQKNDMPAILIHGAMFNHSCLPNLVFGLKEGNMTFITTKHISKGEELTDNYVNLIDNVSLRNKRLVYQYGFKCKCARCKDNIDHDIYDGMVHSIEIKRSENFNINMHKDKSCSNNYLNKNGKKDDKKKNNNR